MCEFLNSSCEEHENYVDNLTTLFNQQANLQRELRNLEQDITKEVTTLDRMKLCLEYHSSEPIYRILSCLEWEYKHGCNSEYDQKRLAAEIDKLRRNLDELSLLSKREARLMDKQQQWSALQSQYKSLQGNILEKRHTQQPHQHSQHQVLRWRRSRHRGPSSSSSVDATATDTLQNVPPRRLSGPELSQSTDERHSPRLLRTLSSSSYSKHEISSTDSLMGVSQEPILESAESHLHSRSSSPSPKASEEVSEVDPSSFPLSPETSTSTLHFPEDVSTAGDHQNLSPQDSEYTDGRKLLRTLDKVNMCQELLRYFICWLEKRRQDLPSPSTERVELPEMVCDRLSQLHLPLDFTAEQIFTHVPPRLSELIAHYAHKVVQMEWKMQHDIIQQSSPREHRVSLSSCSSSSTTTVTDSAYSEHSPPPFDYVDAVEPVVHSLGRGNNTQLTLPHECDLVDEAIQHLTCRRSKSLDEETTNCPSQGEYSSRD